MFRVTEYTIKNEKIKTPVRIAQISDLHEKSFGRKNRILFETVEGLRPDLVAITGDMIYHSHTKHPNLSLIHIWLRSSHRGARGRFPPPAGSFPG